MNEPESMPEQSPMIAALDKIQGWVAAGARVALTCFERLPQQCHRHCVAEALEHMSGAKLRAHHL